MTRVRHSYPDLEDSPAPGFTTRASSSAIAKGSAAVFLWCAIATIVIAWPVLRHPTTQMFGTEIAGRHHDPFTVMWQFATGPPAPPYRQPLVDDVGHALARAIGPVAAFNAIVLITFPLSAATAYALARYLQLPPGAAAIAAFAFAFAPFRLAHAAYHAHIVQTQLIPLYLLGLWACVDRATLGRAALLAGSLTGLAAANLYGAFICVVVTPVALVCYRFAIPRALSTGATRRMLGTLAAITAVAASGVALVVSAAPDVLLDRQRFAFASSDLVRDGARVWAYLVPSFDHPLLGSFARGLWGRTELRDAPLEQQLTLGWVLLGLACVPVVVWARSLLQSRRSNPPLPLPPPLRYAPALLGVAFWAALCSAAPNGIASTPAELLHVVAPMFRAYARFGIVTQLMVALLAGIAITYMRNVFGQLRPTALRTHLASGAVPALLVIAAIEYAPLPWRARDVLPTGAHRWLASQPFPVRAVDCVPRTPAVALVPWLMQREISPLSPLLPPCDDPALPEHLAARGYTHLIVRREQGAGREGWAGQTLTARAGLTYVQSFAGADLYEVSANKAAIVVLDDAAGFYEPEQEGRRTWRWMGERGTWTVRNSAPVDVPVIAELELAAFASARRLRLAIDDREVATLTVTPERRRYQVPLNLAPGDRRLSFVPLERPTIADHVMRNGDPRPLTIALSDRGWMAPVTVSREEGFFDPEHGDGRTWRWMGQRGAWTLRNTAAASVRVVLQVELAAFAFARRLAFSLDDRPAGTARVDVAPKQYRLGPFPLTPGDHRLAFESLEPAAVADTLLRNGDRRALAIRVSDGRWNLAPVARGRS